MDGIPIWDIIVHLSFWFFKLRRRAQLGPHWYRIEQFLRNLRDLPNVSEDERQMKVFMGVSADLYIQESGILHLNSSRPVPHMSLAHMEVAYGYAQNIMKKRYCDSRAFESLVRNLLGLIVVGIDKQDILALEGVNPIRDIIENLVPE